jgi:cytochrome c
MARADIVELLLKAGANPNIAKQSSTALHIAADQGCLECVVLLANAGADVNARTSERATALHLAKRNGHNAIVDYLKQHGVHGVEIASIEPLLPAASLEHGKASFAKLCSPCHQTDPQLRPLHGPILWNVVGRKRGAITGYKYSMAMKEAGGIWDLMSIGTFIADPAGTMPGTQMAFAGLDSDQERADVVLYLRSLSDDPVPLH